ncbi:MAG: hypothetical protein WA435_09645 [Gallionellaceae bacterium]
MLGHQAGGGAGKDLATIGGAVGGAYAGHQVEKKSKQRAGHHVVMEMADGTSRTFKFHLQPSYKVGDSVTARRPAIALPVSSIPCQASTLPAPAISIPIN